MYTRPLAYPRLWPLAATILPSPPYPHDQISPSATEHIERLRYIQEEIKASMKLAQEIHARAHNERHDDTPTFEIGQKVWLESTNITTDRPSKKFAPRRLGPYPIITKIGTHAYRLSLPHSMKIHPVFHVNLLSAHHTNTIPGQNFTEPPAEIVEGEEQYEVESILNSRYFRNQLQYRVRWLGYDESYDTWEPLKNIEDSAPLAIQEFHTLHPDAWSKTKKPQPRHR